MQFDYKLSITGKKRVPFENAQKSTRLNANRVSTDFIFSDPYQIIQHQLFHFSLYASPLPKV